MRINLIHQIPRWPPFALMNLLQKQKNVASLRHSILPLHPHKNWLLLDLETLVDAAGIKCKIMKAQGEKLISFSVRLPVLLET